MLRQFEFYVNDTVLRLFLQRNLRIGMGLLLRKSADRAMIPESEIGKGAPA
jgi:hypothetical protein